MCRWQATPITGWSVPLIGIGVYVYLLAMTWMTGKDLPIVMLLGMVSFVPVCIVWGALGFRKVRSLSRDLLMPVRRDAFLRQLGTAAAIGQFQVWTAVVIANILLMLTVTQEPHPLLLAHAIAFSALSQIWMFGLTVWIMRYRSLVLNVVGMMFALYSTMMPMIVLDGPPLKEWQPILLPIGAILAIFGLLLTWSAYRRWLVADLD